MGKYLKKKSIASFIWKPVHIVALLIIFIKVVYISTVGRVSAVSVSKARMRRV